MCFIPTNDQLTQFRWKFGNNEIFMGGEAVAVTARVPRGRCYDIVIIAFDFYARSYVGATGYGAAWPSKVQVGYIRSATHLENIGECAWYFLLQLRVALTPAIAMINFNHDHARG